jgi:hypothetical protein
MATGVQVVYQPRVRIEGIANPGSMTDEQSLRFSKELSALHAKFKRLLRLREDLEGDLQRQCSK